MSDSVILSVSFVPKKAGTTSIVFNMQGLKDSNHADIPVASWDGVSLQILEPPLGDFDDNGIVDLRDTILALKVMAGVGSDTVHPDEDISGDNRIGIEEVIYTLGVVGGLQ